jgi:putative phage-type endonuclease
MNRQIITPDDEAHWHALRASDLTSTDIAALFHLSPYKTYYELWWEKKAGERVEIDEGDRIKWGRRLEPTVAAGIAEDRGWAIRPMKEYMRLPGLRLGSSFDFRVIAKISNSPGYGTNLDPDGVGWTRDDSPDDALLEIKCVDWLIFRDGWTIDEGFIEAPPHIEIQVQHQMLVSGLRRAYIGVMVGGNRIEVIERTADEAVQRGILAKAAEFWQSIDANTPPDPVMPDDADAVIRMNQYAQPGKLFDARGDAEIATLLREYHRIKREARDLEEIAKVHKADILTKIGDAEKVIADGFTVSAGIVGPAHIEYEREGYRNFRVFQKKAAPAVKEAAE